jgi:hypothetical protein
MKQKVMQLYRDNVNQVSEIWKEFKLSNNYLYTVIKHKNFISGCLALLALISGTLGFLLEGVHIFGAIEKSFALFGLNFPDGKQYENNVLIFIAAISAVLSIFLIAVVFFLTWVI